MAVPTWISNHNSPRADMEQNDERTTETASSPPAPETPKPLWKRGLRFVILRGVFWYAVICLVMMFFQRSLIYRPATTEAIPLSEALRPAGSVQEISFETADGLTLHGWHYLRKGQACETPEDCEKVLDAATPVVLFFHGNGGDRRGRVMYYQILSQSGADVFAIDYRGYGENPGSPSEAGLAEDARGLWKYATETRRVSPGRIVLFGESLGGGVAVRLAQEVCQAGTPPAGLIVRSSFSSLTETAGSRFPWLPVPILLWDRFPSADCVGDVTCPILMFHGTRDQVVPYELGQKLFAAAPDRSQNHHAKQFVTLEGAGHNGILSSHEPEFAEAIGKFLAQLAADGEKDRH